MYLRLVDVAGGRSCYWIWHVHSFVHSSGSMMHSLELE